MSKQALVRLLEVLSVLTIIASLVAIGIPKRDDLARRRTASQVLDDIEIVRTAVYAFYSDSAYFPVESPDGLIPEHLVDYLPRNFSFRRSYGAMEYKNWPVSEAHRNNGAAQVVGLTLTPNDPKVAATALAKSPLMPRIIVGNKYTFLFFGG